MEPSMSSDSSDAIKPGSTIYPVQSGISARSPRQSVQVGDVWRGFPFEKLSEVCLQE